MDAMPFQASWLTVADAVSRICFGEPCKDDAECFLAAVRTWIAGEPNRTENDAADLCERTLEQISLGIQAGQLTCRGYAHNKPLMLMIRQPPSPIAPDEMIGASLRLNGEVVRHGICIHSRVMLCQAEIARFCADVQEGEEQLALAQATDVQICSAVRTVYDLASEPPNLAQIWTKTRDLLHSQMMRATKAQVQSAADSPEFKARRRPSGEKRSSQ